ncbi:hypothetical protein D3C86_1739740 [compost metagenome]
MAIPLQQALDHFAIERHVFDHQHLQCRPGHRHRHLRRHAGSRLQRQLEPETTAMRDFTGDPDTAAHLLDQVFADRQSQPGAAKALRHFLAGLGKALENLRLHLRRNANAVVGDAHPQAIAATPFGLRKQRHVDTDLAALGELDGIGQQVAQNLS